MTDEKTEEKLEYPEEPIRMSPEALTQFIDDFLANRIFTDLVIPRDDPHLVLSVFMPLGLGMFADAPKSYLEKCGLLWESIDKAAPLSVNGYPSFFSVNVMHVEDWEFARKHIAEEMEAREARKAAVEKELGGK